MLSSNAKACKAALLPCRLISEYSAEQVLSESYHVKNIDDFVAAQIAVHRSCQTVFAEEKALHGDEVGNIALPVVIDIALNRCRHLGSAARYLGVRKSALVNFQVVDLTLEAGVVTIVGFADIAACARAHIGYLTVSLGGLADVLYVDVELCGGAAENHGIVVPACAVSVALDDCLIAP